MSLGAYRETAAFAYPGWRLTVPGGPAGGHYKGFTHTQAAGTDIPPNDQYEQDREDGMSSHDPVHASCRNPRGVYRSSGEVPPRPNASGGAHTYRGFQTQRHPGTSVAPGSFPADFFETLEDVFLQGLGALPVQSEMIRAGEFTYPAPPYWNPIIERTVNTTGLPRIPIRSPLGPGDVNPMPGPITLPATGATSVVAQPVATPLPLPPAQSIPVASAVPVSPTPAPIVATNEVVPLNDGSGNFVNVSTGQILSPASVAQNPATGQLTAPASSAMSWLEENTIFSALPNWGVLAIGLLGASMLLGKRR